MISDNLPLTSSLTFGFGAFSCGMILLQPFTLNPESDFDDGDEDDIEEDEDG